MEALSQAQAGDIVLIQQEIPAETVRDVVLYCDEHDMISILNPAPFREVEADVIDKATYITPNETESNAMFQTDIDKALERYPNKLIITLGDKGAMYHNGTEKFKLMDLSELKIQQVLEIHSMVLSQDYKKDIQLHKHLNLRT